MNGYFYTFYIIMPHWPDEIKFINYVNKTLCFFTHMGREFVMFTGKVYSLNW